MASDPFRPDDDPPSALPRGTRLGEFELLHVLGIGGFGIVYLAFDHALEREVAVKEYMPAALAGRTATLHVSLRSQGDAETFALGLKSFVNEARLLARFDHPSLVKVHRFWEANGTAYMAMPVYRGRTLKEVRRSLEMPPDEAWLRGMLVPLLGAIERLHGEGVYHRDIAPDNIQIEADGRPVLLDFGAARRVITDKSQTLTAILKPAYAPIEQYGEAGSVRQGPWTDFYALGATLHFLLLGRPPAPATARAVHDDVQPLAQQALPGCSVAFLQTIDWMLAPRPVDRPQRVSDLRNVLDGLVPPPQRLAAPAAPLAEWERTQAWMPAPAATGQGGPHGLPPTAARAADEDGTRVRPTRPAAVAPPVPASAAPQAPASPPSSPPAPPHPPATPPTPPAAPAPVARAVSPTMLVAAVLGGGAAVAAAAWLFWPGTASGPQAAAPDAAASTAATSTSTTATASAAAAASTAPTSGVPASAPLAGLPMPASAAAPLPGPPVAAVAAAVPPSAVRAPARPPAARSQPAVVAPAPPVLEARPVEAPSVDAAPPAPAPVRASAPAAAARLVGPVERCGSRLLLALWRCMERECKAPELRGHPECVQWRNDEQQRQQRDPSMQ